jgi:hypothetical protein
MGQVVEPLGVGRGAVGAWWGQQREGQCGRSRARRQGALKRPSRGQEQCAPHGHVHVLPRTCVRALLAARLAGWQAPHQGSRHQTNTRTTATTATPATTKTTTIAPVTAAPTTNAHALETQPFQPPPRAPSSRAPGLCSAAACLRTTPPPAAPPRSAGRAANGDGVKRNGRAGRIITHDGTPHVPF